MDFSDDKNKLNLINISSLPIMRLDYTDLDNLVIEYDYYAKIHSYKSPKNPDKKIKGLFEKYLYFETTKEKLFDFILSKSEFNNIFNKEMLSKNSFKTKIWEETVTIEEMSEYIPIKEMTFGEYPNVYNELDLLVSIKNILKQSTDIEFMSKLDNEIKVLEEQREQQRIAFQKGWFRIENSDK